MKKLLITSLLVANGVIATPFVIKDIRVDGTEADTGKMIIQSLPLKVGQTATDEDVANIVRQLFVQNRFDDVRAVREGNTLVLKVVERALINNVDIDGNKAIPKDALEQNLKTNLISKGEVFDPERLENFRKALIEHYHAMGRYNVQIEKQLTKAESGRTNIKLLITEGDVSYVKKIEFVGNHTFSSKELIKALDIKPDVSWWNIFESSKFEQESYNKDQQALRNYYMDRGYAKFTLEEPVISFSDDKKDVTLTYKINEGDKYNISDIRIIGNTAQMGNELNQTLANFKPGQLFRSSELAAIEEDIKQKLGDNGFASAKVELHPTFDDINKTLRVNFVVDAGQRIYVRKIRFEGNDVTADSTLRREMRQQEGAWLSTSMINLSKARLERTGFYDSVEMGTQAVPETPDQVDLIYRIKERNTGSINFGVSYGTENGIGYQAGIKQDNFLGMGSSISLSGQRNDYGMAVNLGYTEPYFTKDGVSLGGNVFYEDYDNSKNSSAASYKRTTYGINGTLGFPVDENNSYYLGLGYTRDKLKNVTREFNRELYVRSMKFKIDPQLGYYPLIKTDDFDFSFGWNYNSLDRGFLPTKGTVANLGGKVTIPGSDNKYYKANADIKSYFPLNREHKWIISTRLGLSYANGFGGKGLPFFQTYSAGGIGSLRGFAYGALGPQAIYLTDPNKAKAENRDQAFDVPSYDVVGGNAMASASVELIMPTPFISEKYQHNVRTSLFVDAASVWNTKWKTRPVLDNRVYDYTKLENFKDYKHVRASAGVAFQWNSPIGPLIFSYAKPIRKYENDEIEQFQFSIGGSF